MVRSLINEDSRCAAIIIWYTVYNIRLFSGLVSVNAAHTYTV